jgi:hypothetical protein
VLYVLLNNIVPLRTHRSILKQSLLEIKIELVTLGVLTLMLGIWGYAIRGDIDRLACELSYSTIPNYFGGNYSGGEGLAVMLIGVFLWIRYIYLVIKNGSFRYKYNLHKHSQPRKN